MTIQTVLQPAGARPVAKIMARSRAGGPGFLELQYMRNEIHLPGEAC
jgi:hypothetical protein